MSIVEFSSGYSNLLTVTLDSGSNIPVVSFSSVPENHPSIPVQNTGGSAGNAIIELSDSYDDAGNPILTATLASAGNIPVVSFNSVPETYPSIPTLLSADGLSGTLIQTVSDFDIDLTYAPSSGSGVVPVVNFSSEPETYPSIPTLLSATGIEGTVVNVESNFDIDGTYTPSAGADTIPVVNFSSEPETYPSIPTRLSLSVLEGTVVDLGVTSDFDIAGTYTPTSGADTIPVVNFSSVPENYPSIPTRLSLVQVSGTIVEEITDFDIDLTYTPTAGADTIPVVNFSSVPENYPSIPTRLSLVQVSGTIVNFYDMGLADPNAGGGTGTGRKQVWSQY